MITNEFYSILCEIAYGLRNKVKEYDKESKKQHFTKDNYNHYVKDPYLIRSINKLYAFALKNKCINEKGEVLAPKDETQAIENYFSIGIGKWIDNWCESMKKVLRDFIDIDPLVMLAPNNKFILTETCKELAMECTTYDKDAEQYKLFKQLRKLEQSGYVVRYKRS